MQKQKFSHILFNLDNHVKKFYSHNYHLFHDDLDFNKIESSYGPIDKYRFFSYMKTVRYHWAISYMLRLSKNKKYTFQYIADYFGVTKQTVSEWVRKTEKDMKHPIVYRTIKK